MSSESIGSIVCSKKEETVIVDTRVHISNLEG